MSEFTTIVTVGHVDHGKSSVIGRMLYDSHAIPDEKVQAVETLCSHSARPFEYAFLLDALKLEQAQGITLDVARYTFVCEGRQYEILDAPGHLELLKNMVTGASLADAALLVIDAVRGIESNTRQHAYYLKLLNVAQVIVAVNKMDLVGYDQKVYDDICNQIYELFHSIGFDRPNCVPTSAFGGDNIISASVNMPWFSGSTLLRLFEELGKGKKCSAELRLPVQDIYRFSEYGDDRRIIAGTILSGRLAVGDQIKFLPSGKVAQVKTIESLDGRKTCAVEGEAVGFTTTDELVLFRGETAVGTEDLDLTPTVCVKASLFWLGRRPLKVDKEYVFKQQTTRTNARILSIESILDASVLRQVSRDEVYTNEIATVTIGLENPIVFDSDVDSEINRFVIVDDNEISGGGRLTQKQTDAMYDGKHLKRTKVNLSAKEREYFHLRNGAVVWLTGISGSGKSTIATGVCRELAQLGVSAYILDGDDLRSGINSDLDFLRQGRFKNVIRTAQIARILKDAGVVVLVTLISPYREDREEAKRIVGDRFVGVYVKTHPETCRKRDPKRLYCDEAKGKLNDFSRHINDYEPPQNADIVVDTESMSEMDSVKIVLDYIVNNLL